jgi:hypothetical protein
MSNDEKYAVTHIVLIKCPTKQNKQGKIMIHGGLKITCSHFQKTKDKLQVQI